jgi:hypothetical protein
MVVIPIEGESPIQPCPSGREHLNVLFWRFNGTICQVVAIGESVGSFAASAVFARFIPLPSNYDHRE